MDEPVVREPGALGLELAAVLGDPVRRRLHAFVVDSLGPAGRDEAAAAVGVTRSAAGYHLDQLVAQGLLAVTYARRSGRSGPGAGRPAKLYEPTAVEVTVQLPARDDLLAAHLLATAVEADTSGQARTALRAATRAAGRDLGIEVAGDAGGLVQALAARGYAPWSADDGIRLRNCPFHHLLGDHVDLICTLNRDLLDAAATAAQANLTADLDPQPGRCCVVLRPTPPTD